MKKIEPADIQSLEPSIIDYSVRFNDGNIQSSVDMYNFRKAHLGISDMFWITKRVVVDKNYFVFNPMALIIVMRN